MKTNIIRSLKVTQKLENHNLKKHFKDIVSRYEEGGLQRGMAIVLLEIYLEGADISGRDRLLSAHIIKFL